jgi:hypothetical protein
MTRREKLLTVFVVVLIGAVTVLLSRNGPSDARPISEEKDSTEVPGVDTGNRNSRVVESTREGVSTLPERPTPIAGTASTYSMPMPERSQPLALQLDALKTRASEGDPVAACALALDTLQCMAQGRASENLNGIERSAAEGRTITGSDQTINLLAQASENMARSSEYCSGIDQSELPTPDVAVKNALRNMSVRQRVLLALSTPDGQIMRFPREFLPPKGIGQDMRYVVPQYIADHGYNFLRQGVEAADPLALEGLMFVHLPIWHPAIQRNPALSMPNPRLFVTYASLLRELIGVPAFGSVADATLSRVAATLSPEEMEKVQVQVKQAKQRWQAMSARRATEDEGLDARTACSE